MRRMIGAGPPAKRPPHIALARRVASGLAAGLASLGTVAVALLFAVRGLPTTVVIDANGKLVGRVEGAAEWDMPKMLMALQPFLPARKQGDALKRAARQGG